LPCHVAAVRWSTRRAGSCPIPERRQGPGRHRGQRGAPPCGRGGHWRLRRRPHVLPKLKADSFRSVGLL
jgi:hypothetical protein